MSFDTDAKKWDTEKRASRAQVIANEIKNSIYINKNQSAMEFGCGTGLVSFNLYDSFKTIAMIDSSRAMIDVLNTKINQCKITNMFPYNLDILNEDTADMKFDVIYNSMVLHHIQDTKAIINKFYEMLNKDGYLCIVDLDKEDGSFHKNYPDFNGHNGFDQNELKSILISSGFEAVESNTFYYDEKIIEGKKINYSLFLMKARKL